MIILYFPSSVDMPSLSALKVLLTNKKQKLTLHSKTELVSHVPDLND